MAMEPMTPETWGPDPGCSELALPLLQPGEEEEGGIRGRVGVGKRVHTEGTGESMGGVGGVVRGGRGPGASRGPFNCDRGRISSTQTKRQNKERNRINVKCRAENNQRTDFESKKYMTQTIKCFTVDFIVFKLCSEEKSPSKKHTAMSNHIAKHSQLTVDRQHSLLRRSDKRT